MAQLPRKSAKKLRMRVAGVVSHRHPRQSTLGLAEKGITLVCSTSKANPPHSGLDRLCYKNEPFVSSGQLLSMLKQLAPGDTVMVTRIDRLRTQHL